MGAQDPRIYSKEGLVVILPLTSVKMNSVTHIPGGGFEDLPFLAQATFALASLCFLAVLALGLQIVLRPESPPPQPTSIYWGGG